MRKNVADQNIGAQITDVSGSAVTAGLIVVHRVGDAGTQVCAGNATHEGQGFWTYNEVTAGGTNFDHIAFTFVGTAASGVIPVTQQVYTVSDGNILSTANVTAAVSAVIANVLNDKAISTLTQADVSAACNDALVDLGVSTLDSAAVSAAVDDALVNLGVSTLDSAAVSAAVDDALVNLGVLHTTNVTAAVSAVVMNALNDKAVSTLTAADIEAQASAGANDALVDLGVLHVTNVTAAVSAVVANVMNEMSISTLDSAAVSAAVDDALVNLGVSTLDSAGVSAAVDDAINALFTFSTAGNVDANITYVNAVKVSGVGTTANPWRPAE